MSIAEFSMTLCFGFVVDQYYTHILYCRFRVPQEDSRQIPVNLYKRKIYWKMKRVSSLKPA